MSEDPTMPDLLGSTTAVRSLEPELLLQMIRTGIPLVLVDVRPRTSRTTGTLEGARSFPLRQLGARLSELRGARSAHVVVLSRTGSRAKTAATVLCLAGFADVSTLEGGLERWHALGYPLIDWTSEQAQGAHSGRGEH